VSEQQAELALAKKTPASGSRGSPRAVQAPGAARLLSHHMSGFAHASDNECLSLVALRAFERAAFRPTGTAYAVLFLLRPFVLP
jgi:hypothetical protein